MAQAGNDFINTYNARWYNRVNSHVGALRGGMEDPGFSIKHLKINGVNHRPGPITLYEPIGLGTPAIDYTLDPTTLNHLALNTTELNHDYPENWGVVISPSPESSVLCEVLLHGLTWIKVPYDPGVGNFLKISDTDQLVAGDEGKAYVHYKVAFGGSFLLLVSIGLPSGGGGSESKFFRYTLTANMGSTPTAWVAAAQATLTQMSDTGAVPNNSVHDVLGIAGWQVIGHRGICVLTGGTHFILTPQCEPDPL